MYQTKGQGSRVYTNFDLKVGTFNVHGQGKGQVKLRKVKNALIRGNKLGLSWAKLSSRLASNA